MSRRGAGADVTVIPVLYVHNSSLIAGANKIMLGLFDQLRDSEFRPVVVLPDAGPMEGELRQHGVRYAVQGLTQAARKGRLASLWMATEFVGRMLRERVRLVHVTGPPYYRCTSVAARFLGLPAICHLHLPPGASELRWAFQIPPHAMIACSDDLRHRLPQMLGSVTVDTIVSIPNAVDVDALKPPDDAGGLRERLGLSRTAPVVTIVGLVSERKGHRYFLEMAQQVLVSFPEAQFLIVGDDTPGHGAYRYQMEQYAGELGVGKQVKFLGFRHNASDWIATSDVVALPTLQEGLPVSLVEAHACGKPVVATWVDGIPEIVEDGVTGILVPPRDTHALSRAMATLLADQSLRKRMGAAARDRAERLFSMNSYAENMKALYRQLLR